MRCLISNSTSPYFNLAAEEYFLKNSTEEFFMLYINDPCIVVGKHQNLLSEINHKYITTNKIALARRISGGGTVYQDANNLNFSFIHNCEHKEKINFQKFTSPILEVLTSMGVQAGFSGRNDLIINNKKFSGNAMHIFKNRVLSHGTLLFKSDLSILSKSLHNRENRYHDKSIKSVRSEVTNLITYLPSESLPNISEFTNNLFQAIVNKMEDHTLLPITVEETDLILNLSAHKFITWEWIYGYSPKYTFHNQVKINDLDFEIQLTVEKGIIKEVWIESSQALNMLKSELIKILIGTKHDFDTITEIITHNQSINSHLRNNITEFCIQLF